MLKNMAHAIVVFFTRKIIKNCLTVFICSLFLVSCSLKAESSLIVNYGKEELTLKALNKTAKSASVSKPEKSSYLYFAFPSDFSLKKGEALQLFVSRNSDKNGNFCFGWLYDDDFSSLKSLRLKKELSPRNLVGGVFSGTGSFLISFEVQVDKNIKGFFVFSESPVSIESSSIVPAKYGWLYDGTVPWFGFDYNGGVVSGKSFSMKCRNEKNKRLSVHLTPYSMEHEKDRIVVSTDLDESFSIRQAPRQKQISLYPSAVDMTAPDVTFTVSSGSQYVTGLVYEPLEKETSSESLTPVPVDPGLISKWPVDLWRISDFEVFSWEQFPYVLFFDTANYDIQDKMFKRLAFFAEKGGYRGKLATDAAMEGQHGFNAHDYRAETLASFFELARLNNFSLNNYELALKNILVKQGIIIIRHDGSIDTGLGALVSISQESVEYLRNLFIAHEGLHCLYFTDADFRTYVAGVYEQTDPESLHFLIRYFTVTSDLNYDLNDTYLIQNEFMAYLMQQPVSRVSEYFTKNIAAKKTINKTNPELVQYILDTNAEGFIQPARKLNNYIYSKWGYSGGRISLVSK